MQAIMQTIAQSTPPEERLRVTIRLPKSVDRAMEDEAYFRDVSTQQVDEEAVRKQLRRKKGA
jgi:hypothetical protein